MNLYLISQNKNSGWDTYDSAVVAAKSAASAKKIHPNEYVNWDTHSWANPKQVEAEFIGKAKKGTKAGVICASFNAG